MTHLLICGLLALAGWGVTTDGYALTRSEGIPVEIGQTWDQGFSGMIRVLIENPISGGWTMTLEFPVPVQRIDIWRAVVIDVSADNKTFTLENMSWNGNLNADSILEMSFNGVKQASDPAPASALLYMDGAVPVPSDTTITPTTASPAASSTAGSATSIAPPSTTATESPCGDTGVKAEITNEWTGGFGGVITACITQPITGGWTMTLVFPVPVASIDIWLSQVVSESTDSTTFILENMPWNPDLVAGSVFVMTFNGVTAGGTAPDSALAYFGGSAPDVPDTTPTTSGTATSTAPPEESQEEEGEEEDDTPTTTTTTTTSAPTTTTTAASDTTDSYDYAEVLHKSILFYEAQRSGPLPTNNRVPWRGDSALQDQGQNGEDLTGGWYDAGDFVKFNFPGAYAATVLTWGLLESWEGYERAGELENMLDSVKWQLDYFIKCHTGPNEVYGQVGNGVIDHMFWGRAEEMSPIRPAYKLSASKPGSDLAAEMAAAMAAGSIAFKDRDEDYSNTLLAHAREVYDFAYNYRGRYSDSISDAANFYRSWSGYEDELGWGALWLHQATGDSTYLDKALEFRPTWHEGLFSWDDKRAGYLALHCSSTGDPTSCNGLQTFVTFWMNGVTYTPGGLAYGGQQWGTNRYAANAAFIALMAAKSNIRAQEAREFARSQIDYMLGDSGRSYVCGFGHNPPTRPHHSGASCPDLPASCNWNDYHFDGPNPHVLYGALVGGPDDQDHYVDDREDYVFNEVAIDYNAGFQSAVAALLALNSE